MSASIAFRAITAIVSVALVSGVAIKVAARRKASNNLDNAVKSINSRTITKEDVISKFDDEVLAIRSLFAHGKVVWSSDDSLNRFFATARKSLLAGTAGVEFCFATTGITNVNIIKINDLDGKCVESYTYHTLA